MIALTNEVSAQVEFQASGSLEYQDNPRRQVDNEQSDLLREASARLGYHRETGRFDTDLSYQARRLDYREDLQRDRTFVEGRSSIVWKALPETFTWHLSNSRTLQPLSVAGPDISDNRQIVDIKSTGPSLTLRPGGSNQLNLGLDYMEAEYSDSAPPGQTRKTGNISFSRYFSPRFTFRVSANAMDTEFEGGFRGLDFKRYTASVTQILTRENLQAELEVGQYEVRREIPGLEKQDNLLLNVNAAYEINSRLAVSASYSRSAEDLLSSIMAPPRAPGGPGSVSPPLGTPPTGPIVDPINDFVDEHLGDSLDPGVFEQKIGRLGLSYTIPDRMVGRIDYTDARRAYQTSDNSRSDESVAISATFPINARLSLALQARHTDLEFHDQARTQKRIDAGARASYQLNQRLNMSFSLFKTKQSAMVDQDRYDGFNVRLSLTYRH